MTIELNKFADKQTMTTALADAICTRLSAAIDNRGCASLVVSGGSTPTLLFQALAQRALAWDKVTVTLTDERWVENSAAASNEKLVRDTLLQGAAASATFVALKTSHANPYAAEAEVHAAITAISLPFDIVLLGMGEDGHTASLFPDAEALPQALDMQAGSYCKGLEPRELPEHAPYPRMTLTLPAILNSQWLVLLLAGTSKLDVYEQAMAGDDDSAMPVRAVLKQQQTPIDVYWAP